MKDSLSAVDTWCDPAIDDVPSRVDFFAVVEGIDGLRGIQRLREGGDASNERCIGATHPPALDGILEGRGGK